MSRWKWDLAPDYYLEREEWEELEEEAYAEEQKHRKQLEDTHFFELYQEENYK